MLWRIFFVMLRIGALTFGGGYAMIPQMSRDFVEKYRWIEQKDIVDLFAVAQSAPGIIAVNASILVGYRIAGVAGALVAALGCILPSFAVLVAVTLFYRAFIENPYVLGALRGLRAAVTGLMLHAVVRLRGDAVNSVFSVILCVAALAVAVLFPSFGVIWLILAGGLLGFLVKRPWKEGTPRA